MSQKKKPAAKRSPVVPPADKRFRGQAKDVARQLAELANPEIPRAPDPSSLLVCTSDPFPHLAREWSLITKVQVPSVDHDPAHIWDLGATLEMNPGGAPQPSRFFKGWATHGAFTLDVKVNAVANAPGGWGNLVTTSSVGKVCSIIIDFDAAKALRFSSTAQVAAAAVKKLPIPDQSRVLIADIALSVTGKTITCGAVAIISSKALVQLIAGTSAAAKGLFFDQGWTKNLGTDDGFAIASGPWSFEVMTPAEYTQFCAARGWPEHIMD